MDIDTKQCFFDILFSIVSLSIHTSFYMVLSARIFMFNVTVPLQKNRKT
jgi:hypothetical protein